MGYHVIHPEDVKPTPDRPSETHHLSKSVGLENMGLRFYTVAPGEDIPISGLHYHDEQEEAFYVVDGALRFETPDREFTVERGRLFISEPGSPHRAFNHEDAAEPALVLAMGAPAVEDFHPYEE